nr:sugar-binding domain-containing protein [uncultured Sphaerochaeta sp.]
MQVVPRGEYPRPNFIREHWLSLNGTWEFSFDQPIFNSQITVPFVYEATMSGIGDTAFHETVWYRKRFMLDKQYDGHRVILHFGAVDYFCEVRVNGDLVLTHEGGQTSFSVDITDNVQFGSETVVMLKVNDDPYDMEIPRGKQYWEEKPKSIFYMHSCGIWQSVWIEYVPQSYIASVRITPLFDEKAVKFDYRLVGEKDHVFETELFFEGLSIASIAINTKSLKGSFKILLQDTAQRHWNFYEDMAWSPENPRLFDVNFRLKGSFSVADEVQSYFGMRKISIENGIFMLNNRPYFQRLVLDQGYWPESLMTAPSDDSFIEDIKLVKAMGFNGVRKHQKVEDPRFLFHADKMGLLVWGEIGSAHNYSVSYASRMYKEWMDVLVRDYNHPCIVVWTPLNESWGIQEVLTSKEQQAHCNALVQMTKSIDGTRLVVDNDGWEHTCGDIWSVHDYEGNAEEFAKHYLTTNALLSFKPAGKEHFINGYTLNGKPILVSEFGGIKFIEEGSADSQESWGYTADTTAESFEKHLASLFKALQASSIVQGYCYTQLTDVATERNGLLTEKREPKIPVESMKKINEG